MLCIVEECFHLCRAALDLLAMVLKGLVVQHILASD